MRRERPKLRSVRHRVLRRGSPQVRKKFSSTCTQNVTVSAEFEPVPAYTGSIANYGDCECWCNNTLIGDLDVCDNHPNCGTDKTTCDTEGASRCAQRCANTHPDSFSVKTLFVPEDSYTGPGNSGAPSDTGSHSDYGDCWCLCDGNDVEGGQINVTGSVSGKGVPEQLCLGDGAGQCSEMGLTCDGTLTTRWEYNSSYDGAVFDDSGTGNP